MHRSIHYLLLCLVFYLHIQTVSSQCVFGCKCPSIYTAVCSCGAAGLYDVPQTLNPELQRLTVTGCRFTTLSSNQFNRYLKLTHLVLSDNNLRTIEPDAFHGLRHLKTLVIQRNANLRRLTTHSLGGIVGDGHLSVYLDGNNISVIEERAFEGSRGLRRLDLTNNPLKTIKSLAFAGLYNVNLIRLPRHVKEIEPRSFANLTRVHTLMIEGWEADTLHDGVLSNTFANMTHVDTISISRSRLGVLHARSFGDIRTIRSLRITDSHIAAIKRRSFAGVAHLGELILADNRIDRIDINMFAKLPRRTKVVFERNYVNCTCKNAWIFKEGGKTSKLAVDLGLDDDESIGHKIPDRLRRDNYCSAPTELKERALNTLPGNYTQSCAFWWSVNERLVGDGASVKCGRLSAIMLMLCVMLRLS